MSINRGYRDVQNLNRLTTRRGIVQIHIKGIFIPNKTRFEEKNRSKTNGKLKDV